MVKHTNNFELRKTQNLKNGASIGLTLPKTYAKVLNIRAGEFLKVVLADCQLIIRKI
jgi:antitoxin component of MazEF toxin-antitoxin module